MVFRDITEFISVSLLGLLNWGRVVGNCGFLEGREQCLQNFLGSVIVPEGIFPLFSA